MLASLEHLLHVALERGLPGKSHIRERGSREEAVKL
jgi:hypothetical protein